MFKYFIKNKLTVIAFAFIMPVRALATIMLTRLISDVIDIAMAGDFAKLPYSLVTFVIYTAGLFLLNVADHYSLQRIIESAMNALRGDIYHKFSRLSWLKYTANNKGDYLSRLTNDADVVRESYFFLIPFIVADTLQALVAAAVIFYYSIPLGIFTIAISFAQLMVPIIFGKKLENAGEAFSGTNEKHISVLNESLASFMTGKLFHTEKRIENRYREFLHKNERQYRDTQFAKEYVQCISGIFNRVAYLGIFLLGAYLVAKGHVKLASVIAITQIVPYISDPCLFFVNDISEIKTARASADKIRALLAMEEDNGGNEVIEEKSPDLTVSNLTFGYDDSRKIFEHFNHTFKHSRKYLITGESGCGKSTLLTILAGLRTDYSGKVTIGSHNIERISRKSLAENMCIIETEPFLFDDSIYNNVTLFDSSIGEKEVLQVIHDVGLDKRISTLENGIYTSVKESAGILSAGETQRVALARALVRHPEILLLDESTSHLDSATTAGIEKLVFSLKDVTVIMVSHNSTDTAKVMADEVIELKSAEIAA